MRSRGLIPLLALAGACLWQGTPAQAAELSGSIGIGRTTTRSETTITVYPSGDTYRSTTRTETRGGGIDLVFGRDRRAGHRAPIILPRGPRWGGQIHYGPASPYGPGYYGSIRCQPVSPGPITTPGVIVQPLPAPVVPSLYPGLDIAPR